MFYDPEANILSWQISKSSISHARDFGNFIIHFSKKGKPVMIEMLDASSFVSKLDKLKKREKSIKPLPTPF